jgi:hypothetical protein
VLAVSHSDHHFFDIPFGNHHGHYQIEKRRKKKKKTKRIFDACCWQEQRIAQNSCDCLLLYCFDHLHDTDGSLRFDYDFFDCDRLALDFSGYFVDENFLFWVRCDLSLFQTTPGKGKGESFFPALC